MKGRLDGYLKHKNGTTVLVAIHRDGSDLEHVPFVSIVIAVANPHHKKYYEGIRLHIHDALI